MALPGQLDVTPSGAIAYSIPIAVPPGTGGMVPALTLDYSSSGGNGLVGVGWSLGGLPSIGRCPMTIATDNFRGAVNYDANDRFCLDGQRLIVVSGTYGAAGSEYRTEIDGFSKIIAYGAAGSGPAYFKVWTKSGQVMEFGNSTDSRILAQGSSTARSWAVNKISDTKGNYLTVAYVNDTTNGQAYPTRIDYTGNAGASLAPYNSVQFTYNTGRPDQVPSYHAGSMMKTTALLTNVKTSQGATLVSDYRLTYQNGDSVQPSKLTSVQLCDGASNCLPATSFTWSGGTTSYSLKASPNWGGYAAIPGDWAGTGRSGVFLQNLVSGGTSSLYLSDETGQLTQTGWSQAGWEANKLCLADWNGDGKTDLLVNTDLYTSNGTGFTYLGVGAGEGCGGFYVSGNLGGSYPADYTGDGKSDIISSFFRSIPAAGTLCWTDYFSNDGNGSFTSGGQITDVCYNHTLGDYNGDGKTDFIANNFGRVYLSDGSTFSSGIATAWGSGNPIVPGDFNGDGNTDVLFFNYSTGIATLYLCKGDGTFVATGYSSPGAWYSSSSGTAIIYTGDFNGDGRTDLLNAVSGQGPTFYLSTGTGFVLSGNLGLPTLTFDRLATADFNGDGVSDVLVGSNTSGAITPEYVSTLAKPRITAVTTGLGVSTTITYKPLTDPSVYAKGSGAAYPTIDLQGASYVVSRIDAANGTGGVYSSTYSYSTLRADMNGRGSLGFGQMKVLDLQTNILQTTNYRQDFPYIGFVASQTKTLNGLTLNSKSNTYASTVFGGTWQFPHLTQSVEESHDLDGTALPTVTTSYQYDNYGNPTQITVSTPDGASKTTTNTYTNDTTNWFLGRLTNASVTSTWPHGAAGAENQSPTAVADAQSTHVGVAATFDPRTNDSDPDGDPLTITAKTNGTHGTVQVLSGTQITYTPETGYAGTDSFSYTISDGLGGTASATVTMTMTNTAPVANNDTLNSAVGQTTALDPRSNDSDADGDPLTVTDKTDGAHGTVAITGGGTGLSYTPAGGYSGSDSFTYTISDGNGGTASATVNVTVYVSAVWGSFNWGAGTWGP